MSLALACATQTTAAWHATPMELPAAVSVVCLDCMVHHAPWCAQVAAPLLAPAMALVTVARQEQVAVTATQDLALPTAALYVLVGPVTLAAVTALAHSPLLLAPATPTMEHHRAPFYALERPVFPARGTVFATVEVPDLVSASAVWDTQGRTAVLSAQVASPLPALAAVYAIRTLRVLVTPATPQGTGLAISAQSARQDGMALSAMNSAPKAPTVFSAVVTATVTTRSSPAPATAPRLLATSSVRHVTIAPLVSSAQHACLSAPVVAATHALATATAPKAYMALERVHVLLLFRPVSGATETAQTASRPTTAPNATCSAQEATLPQASHARDTVSATTEHREAANAAAMSVGTVTCTAPVLLAFPATLVRNAYHVEATQPLGSFFPALEEVCVRTASMAAEFAPAPSVLKVPSAKCHAQSPMVQYAAMENAI